MENDDYRGRINQAMARSKLDLEFSHIGGLEDREGELTVHVRSAAPGGV